MDSTVLFSTCSAAAIGLENHAPDGISLRRLTFFDSEIDSFDFSEIHFVANIDPSKISPMDAINYLLSQCSKVNHKHYFELSGTRFSIQDTNAIYHEAEKCMTRSECRIPDFCGLPG
jgi:hypothetical protein